MTQEAKLNLPWTGQAVKASRTRYNYCTIWGRMGVKIADVQGRGRASTEARRDLIVTAVNSHASNLTLITELVGALEKIARYPDYSAGERDPAWINRLCDRYRAMQTIASDALAKQREPR